jgi:hypothetical protein
MRRRVSTFLSHEQPPRMRVTPSTNEVKELTFDFHRAAIPHRRIAVISSIS